MLSNDVVEASMMYRTLCAVAVMVKQPFGKGWSGGLALNFTAVGEGRKLEFGQGTLISHLLFVKVTVGALIYSS